MLANIQLLSPNLLLQFCQIDRCRIGIILATQANYNFDKRRLINYPELVYSKSKKRRRIVFFFLFALSNSTKKVTSAALSLNKIFYFDPLYIFNAYFETPCIVKILFKTASQSVFYREFIFFRKVTFISSVRNNISLK